ncbi:MAG: xanthine dehydrogenase family protein subunit M [Pseudomonadota bacterium]
MRYEAPETLDAAIALLRENGGEAKVLAGGTDLLVQLRGDAIAPDVIVDIKKIDETRTIVETSDGFRIGAAVSGMDMQVHATLPSVWPGVVEAANLIGSTQIQWRATMGGNLCNGSPAADSVPAMIAAGAIASVAGPNGRRDVPVEEVVVGPRKLSLAADEFIVSFLLPTRPDRSGDAYIRFIPRTEMDIAVVGCGVSVSLDGEGTITAARVGLGAVAEKALLVSEAGTAIVGTKLEEGALEALDAAVQAACRPIADKRGTVEFRTEVAGVIARRTAEAAYERASA